MRAATFYQNDPQQLADEQSTRSTEKCYRRSALHWRWRGSEKTLSSYICPISYCRLLLFYVKEWEEKGLFFPFIPNTLAAGFMANIPGNRIN